MTRQCKPIKLIGYIKYHGIAWGFIQDSFCRRYAALGPNLFMFYQTIAVTLLCEVKVRSTVSLVKAHYLSINKWK